MFHRLTVPTYYGGLPGGADYLNTPSLSGGSGVPAFMDGQKVSGPNDGTYFFAFGEDATSLFFNRGLKALGENTDELDNLMRRDLSMPARTADVTTHVPLGSVLITGQVFVGILSTPNTQANRDILISVLDDNDNEILDEYGTKVVASWIHDGSNNNVVGTSSSGFYTNPTVTIAPPIPASTAYRIYYGYRSNLVDMPMDAFTTMRIRSAEEVSAQVELVLKNLHTYTAGVPWNEPWVATINSLARTGLDGRYRLSTYDDYFNPPLDTPGSGAAITRDGPAITFNLPEYLMSQQGSELLPYPDPFMACLRLEYPATIGVAYNKNLGGDVGLMQLTPYISTGDTDEYSSTSVAGSLLFAASPRDVRDSALGGNTVLTRINASLTATLNPDAGTSAAARSTIQLGAGDYFMVGGFNPAIRRHFDMLEVTVVSTGAVLGVFRVNQFSTDTRVGLLAPTGAFPSIGASGTSTPVRVRWVQTTVDIGGRHSAANGMYGVPHFVVAQPSHLTEGYDSNDFAIDAAFLSAYSGYHRGVGAINFNGFVAMAWGGFDPMGYVEYNGYLQGDGGIVCSGGRQQLNFLGRDREGFAAGASGRTVSYYLGGSGNFAEIYTSGAAWTAATFNFYLYETAYIAQGGDEFDLMFHIPPGSSGPIVMNWYAPMVFSGSDGIVPVSNPGGSTITVYYKFIYSTTLAAWVATRTDY
jgi:hypothetical protein